MSVPETIVVSFPFTYGPSSKVPVIKAIRSISYMGLKEAKDLSEVPGSHALPVSLQPSYAQPNDELFFEEQCQILRNNGVDVGPSVHKILQSLRDLGAEALRQGDDDLANEIMQLVLAEKLRRKP